MSKITGFTCGAFDLVHPGHLLMFKECRMSCDELWVGLQEDPSIDRPEKHKPIESLDERIIRLEACKYVDKIFIYSTEEALYDMLKEIKPDVRFLGADWEGKKFTGDDLDIRIVYNSRDHGYSSSNLRERIKNNE